MKNFYKFIVMVLVLTVIVLPVVSTVTKADSNILGSILKTVGIGVVVDQFAEPINNFINTLTLNNGVEVKEETKVVPIVTVGSNSYAGAVQVSGPKEKVEKVKAVAQLEGDFKGGDFRIRALIPVNTTNPVNIKNIDRIEGVGITALVDINI
ncbi:MAG: hypothetical protein A8274_819 [Halanaerobium sp. 4-GBenrich]|jgi:hypothetical protein|uniref:Uncharacterized protein n=1 Tax=Halanaerobium congolense TaxID=54121 RepID=A0A1G6LGJ6_9FIRM|nr:hypothetical protein [Halanaerobium congolense]KXS46361.1 MAG: hypothetical protein AWL62_2911 [Halanaerobium sp. T82-1]ODS50223.1 MAG: hypothetical protein A8274_819 [Halanaerobium sp. 4-GBenrich]PUU91766.1 MAG: hypothetical protein CI948_990 [Halanaerobium sp.]PXV68664.1 hypothetical protein C8C78_10451 [Halanaerobium congolense]TDP14193.1 hypothetical protein C8C79_12242 [Halanaerobium congolense]